MKPIEQKELSCPWCFYRSSSIIPNFTIPVIDWNPKLWWTGYKMGRHMTKSHHPYGIVVFRPQKAFELGYTYEDWVDVMVDYSVENIPLREELGGMSSQEIKDMLMEEHEKHIEEVHGGEDMLDMVGEE